MPRTPVELFHRPFRISIEAQTSSGIPSQHPPDFLVDRTMPQRHLEVAVLMTEHDLDALVPPDGISGMAPPKNEIWEVDGHVSPIHWVGVSASVRCTVGSDVCQDRQAQLLALLIE